MHSISPRPSFAAARTVSIMPNAFVPRSPVSVVSASTSPLRATATLRCDEENSSARIVISNFPLRFADDFDFYLFEDSIFHLPLSIFQPFRPFHHRHAVRRQELLDAGRQNLRRRFQ